MQELKYYTKSPSSKILEKKESEHYISGNAIYIKAHFND